MNTGKGTRIHDEKQLIERAQAGGREAFDELAQIYSARMYRMAMRITGNESEAEDAVQQALLGAFQNLSRFRGDSAFSTWVTRITMNEALGIVRKRRKNVVEIGEMVNEDGDVVVRVLASAGETPEAAALREERRRLVHESMSLVKPSYLKVMKLRLIEDLSVEEIGSRLGIPVNTVKVHLYRGRQAMKEYLEPRLARPAA
ncbi:MAG: sigma-70 family RNA polymerase sigma factor [Bryobacteraceae bacterium]|nr:sigma-70 family RNA polymerase sigma factor [Bryobacteraceae bacterium]